MKTWRVELTAGGRSITETKIQRGIFQGDALSPLLFIIAMMPLNHILRKCTAGYKLSRSQEKINRLMYMDDIKLFAKNERELETLIHAVRIYSQDIGTEFGIEKCAMLIMKWNWRNGTTKSRQNLDDRWKLNLQILGHLGDWHHQTSTNERHDPKRISQENSKTTRDKTLQQKPLNYILRKCTARYKLSRSLEKGNHLMYMDDINLFAEKEKELETLIHAVRIYSQDIGMEFGIEKCAMLVMKCGKRHLTDGMEQRNQNKIKTFAEKETYKYLGTLEADTIKQVELKEKIQKEYLRRTRKLLETKLSCRNLIKGINTWAVPLVRYSGPFLKWTKEELNQMDQRTRKLMTMHKALHPRDDVDRLYVSRKEGGRGLASIEDTVDASIQRLEDYIEKHERGLITTIRVDTDNTINERITTTRKQK